MRGIIAIILCLCCFTGFSAENSKKDIVYFLPQFSDFKEVNELDRLFLKRTLKKAEREGAKAVIFEIDTPGGQIDVALKYLTILSKSRVKTIAYVRKGVSAGAIIALAADKIAIDPSGIIGDAMPIQITPSGIKPVVTKPEEDDKESKGTKKSEKDTKSNPTDKLQKQIDQLVKKVTKGESLTSEEKRLAKEKFLTVFYKTLQVLAENNNRPVNVIRAMADPYVKLSKKEDGIEHKKSSPLTLTAKEAKELGVVDYICSTKEEILEKVGLGGCEIVEQKRSALEDILAFLAYPAISGFLITIGMVGVFIEVRSPGFGVPGTLGVSALTLFFFGHVGVGDSDWGPAVLFFISIMLLCLEVFVVPGFGLVGLLGIVAGIASLFWAFGFENIHHAALVISASLFIANLLIIYLTIYVLPKSKFFKRLQLDAVISGGGRKDREPNSASTIEVGSVGVAKSDLRPAGIAVIMERRVDVKTCGDYIVAGDQVVVIEATGMSVVVEKVKPK